MMPVFSNYRVFCSHMTEQPQLMEHIFQVISIAGKKPKKFSS